MGGGGGDAMAVAPGLQYSATGLLDDATFALRLLLYGDVFSCLRLGRGAALHVHLAGASLPGGPVLSTVHGFGHTLKHGARCFGL